MVTQKVFIITGASSGIGKALANACIQSNNFVTIAARNKEKLMTTFNELDKINPGHVHSIVADVSNEEDCKKIISQTIDKFGKIDILINNAGISMRAMFNELHLDVIRSLMNINFWGTVYCTKYALPYIVAQKGSIVAISSIAGLAPLPARTGYSASKAAIQGFLNTLRVEMLKTGIHILVVAPGFTASNIRNTALTADGSAQGETPRDEDKMMTAHEVAKKILNAIDKRKSTLILTTQGKLTVLLYKFFPKLTDKIIYNHMKKEPNSPLP
jgi:short-subunit dehydrogenase